VLSDRRDFTLDSLIAAAYDPYLIAFDQLLPALFTAYANLPAADTLRAALAPEIEALRRWDRRVAIGSVASSVAILWAQQLSSLVPPAVRDKAVPLIDQLVAKTNHVQKLAALQKAVERLERDFGAWQTPWVRSTASSA
jgi:acyl-homoserine-lactone acylase